MTSLDSVLVIGQTYLTRGGKIAVVKMASPYVAEVFNVDGTFAQQAYYHFDGEAKSVKRELDIIECLCEGTVNALDWLQAHSQTILGVTSRGVCVLDTGGEGYNLWLPAKRGALRDFMNY